MVPALSAIIPSRSCRGDLTLAVKGGSPKDGKMSFFDRAKQVAREATGKAKEELEEFRLRLELDKAYQALGKSAFELIDAGELTQTRFDENAERIRELKAQLAAKSAS